MDEGGPFAYFGAGILMLVCGVIFLFDPEMGTALPVFMILFGVGFILAGFGSLKSKPRPQRYLDPQANPPTWREHPPLLKEDEDV